MQKISYPLNERDRRIVRMWRLGALCFYGSILAGTLLYAALHWGQEVDYASVEPTAHAKMVSPPAVHARTPVSH
ncbi:hypothetical protein [Bradyrhizobium sp.]|uniref:hypothetical protein n=1 Tax=Bradyrhizobium sp. TaxID=376 RepID=UPI0039E43A2E